MSLDDALQKSGPYQWPITPIGLSCSACAIHPMPSNIIDFSALSPIIREEPWGLYFWESTKEEHLEFLADPRGFLSKIGIDIPEDCPIETRTLNQDFLVRGGDGGVLVCNTGGGGGGVYCFTVTSFAHSRADVGLFTQSKKLLHSPSEQKVPGS
jgi:hypothetical protein